jgi:hypothetical protein
MHTPRFDIIAVGEPMVEFNQTGEREGRLYLQGFGGDTSNFAIAAARQGARVAYASALGDDPYGAMLRALWDREGVDHSAVTTNAQAFTAIYFVTHDAQGHHFHFFRNGSSSQLHMPWDQSAGTPDPFEKVVGMPMTLNNAGYHIGYTYKWHTKAGLIGEKTNAYMKHGRAFNQYSSEVGKAKDKKAAHEELMREVRGNFQDFLDKRGKGQPFFYSFNPTNTHRKWLQGSGKSIWGLDPDDLKGKLPPYASGRRPTIRE